MNWGSELIDLYEKNTDQVGVVAYKGEVPYVLLPPFHTTVTAQIEVTIDAKGAFLHAKAVDLNDNLQSYQ